MDAPEVEADLLRLDAEFAQDVRQVRGDLLAAFEHGGVLDDLYRAALDPGVRADLLEVADERPGVDAGVALGDDDVVGRDLAGVDRRRRLRGLQLPVEAERVVVRPNQAHLARDVLDQVLEVRVDRLEGSPDERVP